jgi:hypothetical protein
MAAGLGFKDFTTGEVLTAADVDGYLMQGIWVFASNAARDAAVTAPAEGNFAFTKDTNSLWYYDGAAWVASGATGDIEGVTAGVGISGGGTSGTVTVTNSMATAIDAKGDLIAGTGADTFARLAVGGTNGHVLQVDSSTSTGLAWAAPAGGFNAEANYVITDQATSSTSFTDLSTVQSVTLTTGTKALILLSAVTYNSGANVNSISFAVSGATTLAANNDRNIFNYVDLASTSYSISGGIYYDSLTAGSNTFTMKFKVAAGTGNWYNRNIAVIDLGS